MLLFLLDNSLYALAYYCKYLDLVVCEKYKNLGSPLMKVKFFEHVQIKNLYTNGYNHIVVTSNNKIFVFGVNYHGLCCTGDCNQPYLPTEITKYIIGDVIYAKINLHSIFLATLTKDGSQKLYSWGKGSYGELANGDFYDEYYPKEILYFNNVEILNIFVGGNFVFANTKNYIYGWGENNMYQLGQTNNNKLNNRRNTIKHSIVERPAAAHVRIKMSIKKLALGKEFTVALSDAGDIYTWGDNTYGQLGINSNVCCTSMPNIICGIDKMDDVCAGSYHVLAKSQTEKLYSWGDNSCGQLGIGSQAISLIPKIVCLQSPRLIGVLDNTNVAICQDSHIFIWGKNLNNMVKDCSNIISCPILIENNFNHITNVKLGYLYSLVFADCGISIFGLNMNLLDERFIKKFEYKFILCN